MEKADGQEHWESNMSYSKKKEPNMFEKMLEMDIEKPIQIEREPSSVPNVIEGFFSSPEQNMGALGLMLREPGNPIDYLNKTNGSPFLPLPGVPKLPSQEEELHSGEISPVDQPNPFMGLRINRGASMDNKATKYAYPQFVTSDIMDQSDHGRQLKIIRSIMESVLVCQEINETRPEFNPALVESIMDLGINENPKDEVMAQKQDNEPRVKSPSKLIKRNAPNRSFTLHAKRGDIVQIDEVDGEMEESWKKSKSQDKMEVMEILRLKNSSLEAKVAELERDLRREKAQTIELKKSFQALKEERTVSKEGRLSITKSEEEAQKGNYAEYLKERIEKLQKTNADLNSRLYKTEKQLIPSYEKEIAEKQAEIDSLKDMIMSNLTTIKQKEIYTKHLQAEVAAGNEKIKRMARGSLVGRQTPTLKLSKLNASFALPERRNPSADPKRKEPTQRNLVNILEINANFPKLKPPKKTIF